MCAKSLQSRPALCDPVDHGLPAPLSLRFPRQQHWSHAPLQGTFPTRDGARVSCVSRTGRLDLTTSARVTSQPSVRLPKPVRRRVLKPDLTPRASFSDAGAAGTAELGGAGQGANQAHSRCGARLASRHRRVASRLRTAGPLRPLSPHSWEPLRPSTSLSSGPHRPVLGARSWGDRCPLPSPWAGRTLDAWWALPLAWPPRPSPRCSSRTRWSSSLGPPAPGAPCPGAHPRRAGSSPPLLAKRRGW